MTSLSLSSYERLRADQAAWSFVRLGDELEALLCVAFGPSDRKMNPPPTPRPSVAARVT